jgi:hypothetical protein
VTYAIPAAMTLAAVLWRVYKSLPILSEPYRVKVKLDGNSYTDDPKLRVYLAKRFTFDPIWGVQVATVRLGRDDTDEKLYEAKALAHEMLAQATRCERAFR